MTRPRFLPSSRVFAKWFAAVMVVITPGSFFVLPALWAVHHWNKNNAAQSQAAKADGDEKR